MPSLVLSLLGHLAVSWDERPLTTFRSNRVPALLVYLTVAANRPHRREALMELLWPGLPAASARQNLRQTLYLLRQEIPELAAKNGQGIVPLLLSDRHTVQLNPEGDFSLDVTRLEQLVVGQPTADKLAEAVTLYQGDFLADFYLPDSENFEEWAAAKRAAYRRLALDALTKLTAVYLDQANFAEAEKYARQQLEIDNLRESGHRQLMEALAQNGRRRAALSHYESLSQLLQTELSIEPSLETQALVQAIRVGEFVEKREERGEGEAKGKEHFPLPTPHSPLATSAPPHNLPTQATPFIGREAELAALDAFISDPKVRLVTIVGAGGMGKTRLALACGEQQTTAATRFPNGIFFVNLAPLNEAGQMIPTLAEALGFQLQSREDGRSPQQQILDYLRQKKMLLLFDNFEHLLSSLPSRESSPASLPKGGIRGGANLVAEILQAAPEVQILATSRERLHLRAEQVYPIQGLEFPDWETPEDAEEYTAVKLFLQSARRSQPDFALRTSDSLTYLARICRLVTGMPLAIELAAAWVDTLPLAEIAAEIQEGLAFLETERRDIPERHRSIHATIDYSWQNLAEKEQAVFAQLSVFRGGFTRQAAQAVTGANPRLLSHLVNKSFLQYDQARDRYQIHELMRQFGADKLAEDGERETAVRDQHSTYYCQALDQKEQPFKDRRLAMTEIEVELGNMENAWRWAVQRRLWSNLHQASYPLFRFYQWGFRHQDSLALYQLTVNQLAPDNLTEVGDKDTAWVLARVLIWLASCYLYLDQWEQAETLLQQSQALLQSQALAQADTQRDQAFLFLKKAEVAWPDHQAALEFAQKSLILARASGDQWQEAETLRNLGNIFSGLSNDQMAQKSFEDALAVYRSLNDAVSIAVLLEGMGRLARNVMDYQRSEALYKESLTLFRSQSYQPGIADALASLGYLKLFLGEFENGADYLQQSAEVQRENGYLRYLVPVMANLAIAYTFLGHLHQVRQCIEESLAIAEANPFSPGPLQSALETQARINIWMGRYEAAQLNLNRIFSFLDETDQRTGYWHVIPYGPSGWLALAQSNLATARKNLQKGADYQSQFNSREWSAIYQASLGRAEWGLGQQATARQHLYEALAVAVKMRAFITLLHVLPIVPVILAAEDDVRQKARAVEIYALAHSHPFIANCQFFYDIAGKDMEVVEAGIPSDVVAAAKARGEALDFWPTAESLLTELMELGWGEEIEEQGSRGTGVRVVRHNLPSQPTPFIGREAELAALDRLLADPERRLVTIVGPGGMGKTRLALAWAGKLLSRQSEHETHPYPDGVYFVALASLTDPAQMAPTLAEALDFPLDSGGQQQRTAREQILDYLQQKRMLLVLDNLEHLLSPPGSTTSSPSPPPGGIRGGEELVADILQAAPQVQVVTTSRERLHLQEEQVYPIQGLAFPDWEAAPPSGEQEDMRQYTAVQLFLQSARCLQPDLTVQADDLNSLGRICRLVDGMPLAVELAAGWVDMLSLADIAAEIQQSADFLETEVRNVPERHRSMRAVFAASWQRLSAGEQAVFPQLSVFRGGFTRQAAQAITGASLRLLGRLVSKSLLHYDRSRDRYQLHELLRQYGAEKLAEDETMETAVRQQQSHFYCTALPKWETDLKSPRQGTAVAAMKADYQNILIAWQEALRQGQLEQLINAVNGLGEFYNMAERWLEGLALLQESTQTVQSDYGAPPNTVPAAQLLGWLWAWQVKLFISTPDYYELEPPDWIHATMESSRFLLTHPTLAGVDTRAQQAFVHLVWGWVWHRSDFAQSQEHLAASLELYRSLGDKLGMAEVIDIQSWLALVENRLAEAQGLAQGGLKLSQQAGEPRRIALAFIGLGGIARSLSNFAEAADHFERAYATARAADYRGGMIEARTHAIFLAWYLGQFDLALDYNQEQLLRARQSHSPLFEVGCLVQIAVTQIYRGEFTIALAHFEESMQVEPDCVSDWAILFLPMAHLHAGQYETAESIIRTNTFDEHAKFLTWVKLVQADYVAALTVAQQYHARQPLGDPEARAMVQGSMGFALYKLGRGEEARQTLFNCLQTCVAIRAFLPLMQLMPIIPVVLADGADDRHKERAVEVYAMTESLPFVGNSLLFADLTGKTMMAVAETLPPAVVAAAQARGRELDWWPTAESLLSELTELGWGASAN